VAYFILYISEGEQYFEKITKKNGFPAVVEIRSACVSFSKTSFVGLQRKGSLELNIK